MGSDPGHRGSGKQCGISPLPGRVRRDWLKLVDPNRVIFSQITDRNPAAMVALLLACIYLLLAGVHVYWALGGSLGKDAAVPRLPRKASAGAPGPAEPAMVPAFTPTRTGTLLVAAVLAAVALMVGARAGLATAPCTGPVLRWAIGLVALAMLARAVGDFRLVGFFKRVTGSPFAWLDTRVYSPLCLALSAGLAYVVILPP